MSEANTISEVEIIIRKLPQKVYLKQSEVIEATDWTIYFLRQLEQTKILEPLQYREGAHRRYPRNRLVELLKELESK